MNARQALAAAALALGMSTAGTVAVAQPAPADAVAPACPVAVCAAVSYSNTATRITEDDPRWNCLTMGNRTCGAGWRTMSRAELRNWEARGHQTCLIRFGDTTYVVCLDGFTTSS